MNAFAPDAWHDWFVATAGIGAALAGLVFVSFSINLREILKFDGVVERGGEALVLLLSIAVVSVVGLWPADPAWIALALLAVGTVTWVAVLGIFVRTGRIERATGGQKAVRVALGQLATLPVILAGASLLAGVGPGLNLLVVSGLAGLAGGIVGAWVLLVEILR